MANTSHDAVRVRVASPVPDPPRRQPARFEGAPAALPTRAFLSHKSIDAKVAEGIAQALSLIIPTDQIFLSEEIRKGSWFSSK